MRGHLFRGAAVIAALSLATPPLASAQTTEPTEQTEATTLSAEHLDAMLAPIALYPDTLLVQILMASTFPLQVVEASRWLEQPDHKGLQGDALAQALEAVNWDPSVKSLVPFPQVLATLNSQLEWMQQVGYAFATQQADVMASRAAVAAPGAGERQSGDDRAAARRRGERHHRHRACQPANRLRAGLQSGRGLRRLAGSGVSAGADPSACRLYTGQRGRRWTGLREPVR